MKTRKILLLFTCFLLVTTACKNKSGNRENEGFKFEEGELKQSDIEVTKSFIYLFPSPGDLLERFQEADIEFDKDLMHDPAKSDSYLSSRDQGLNLGVYITDMAYSAMFGRSSETVEYLEVIQKMSEQINVSTSAFESLIERAKNNLGQNDSLVSICNEVFYNMVEFLEHSGKESTVAVVSCGSYMEAMYMIMSSLDGYKDDDPVLEAVTEMKYPMENLLSHAESTSEDPAVQSIITYVKELSELFEELDEESSSATKTEPGVISLSGGSAPELDEENFEQMKAKTISIREHITGNN